MRWLDCVQNPDYQVSDTGLIMRKKTQRILKPYQNWSEGGRRMGYLKVSMGRAAPDVYVHQAVAYAFLGPRPDGHDVDHIDHDRFNNSVENLRYLPVSGNRMRWKGPGQHDFVLVKHETAEESYVPMTYEEEEELMNALEEAGWHG